MNRRAWLCGVWLYSLTASCLVDPDKECDANQVELNGKVTGCLCAPGTIPNANGKGCSPCGDHEEAKGGACVCESGYRRPQPDKPCEEATDAGSSDSGMSTDTMASGEGMACSGPGDCAGYDATYCQMLISPYVCLVQGCAVGDSKCSGETVCCDFKDLPPLAPTNGLCIPVANCIAPGHVVDP